MFHKISYILSLLRSVKKVLRCFSCYTCACCGVWCLHWSMCLRLNWLTLNHTVLTLHVNKLNILSFFYEYGSYICIIQYLSLHTCEFNPKITNNLFYLHCYNHYKIDQGSNSSRFKLRFTRLLQIILPLVSENG